MVSMYLFIRIYDGIDLMPLRLKRNIYIVAQESAPNALWPPHRGHHVSVAVAGQ